MMEKAAKNSFEESLKGNYKPFHVKIRKLTVDEIDFRVGGVYKTQKGAVCNILAYKDSRVDMAVLDEVFGSMNKKPTLTSLLFSIPYQRVYLY